MLKNGYFLSKFDLKHLKCWKLIVKSNLSVIDTKKWQQQEETRIRNEHIDATNATKSTTRRLTWELICVATKTTVHIYATLKAAGSGSLAPTSSNVTGEFTRTSATSSATCARNASFGPTISRNIFSSMFVPRCRRLRSLKTASQCRLPFSCRPFFPKIHRPPHLRLLKRSTRLSLRIISTVKIYV